MLIIGNNRGNRLALLAPDREVLLKVEPHGRNQYSLRGRLYDRKGKVVADLDEEIRGQPVVQSADGDEILLSVRPIGNDYLITGKLYDKRGGTVAEIDENRGLYVGNSGGLELG